MTQITTTKRICEHLEKYVYDRIWNEPYTEFRTYTRPELLNSVPVSGFFSGRYSHILLPPHKSPEDLQSWLPTDSSRYFVYSVPDRFFDSIKLNITEWTLLSEFCNENCTDLHVFTKSGFFLNRGAIYIRQADMNDCMLLAVDAEMILEFFGSYAGANDVLFGKYVDSDGKSDNKIFTTRLESYQVKSNTRYRSADNYNWDDFSYLLYNGKLVTGDYREVATQGAYLEGVKDEDIIGYFEVDCDAATRPSYMDTKVTPASERLIVHVPNALNPNRYLITPHTCDMWLVPTEMEGEFDYPIISGSYITLAGMEDKVRQLTHNDFSIEMAFLKNIAETHRFVKYKLRVYVRLHNKKKEFVRDYNYIDMMYNLDDEDIILMLEGKHEWQEAKPETLVCCEYDPELTVYWYEDATNPIGYSSIPGILNQAAFDQAKLKHTTLLRHPYAQLLFWKADHLEDCKYANALIRKRNGKYQSPSTQCSMCANTINCTTAQKAAVAGKCCQRFVKTPANQCSVCGLKQDKTISGDIKEICTIGNNTYECPYYNVRSMRDYVEILGYFHVLSLVGKRMWHFKLKKNDTNQVIIQAPLALSYPELKVEDFYCIVYHNEVRIDQSRITVSSTNKENTDAEEMEHGTGCLSRSTLVIQSNFATKMMVSITPEYIDATDHRVVKGVEYLKYNTEGKLVEPNICPDIDTFKDLSLEDRIAVDYIVDDILNKDHTTEYVETTDLKFSIRVYYAKKDAETTYRRLVVGTDYDVGGSIETYCATTGDKVYRRAPAFKLLKHEFFKNDTLCVEVYDNRKDGRIEFYNSATEIRTVTDDQYRIYKVKPSKDAGCTRNGIEDVVYEYIADPGTCVYDKSKDEYVVMLKEEYKGIKLLLVEGPLVVKADPVTKTIKKDTFGVLGEEFYNPVSNTNFPLDSTLMFMNNKRLIPNLDYGLDQGQAEPASSTKPIYQTRPYIQNLGYIWDGTRANQMQQDITLEYFRTCTTDINSQYGFLIGHTITWGGQAPFWFDELSALTIDGRVCSNYKHTLGMLEVSDKDHRNGAPYEIRTACSSRVVEIVGCQDEQAVDIQKIREIRAFFEVEALLPDMETIIPHSHKIYSTYLEEICAKYLSTTAGFNYEYCEETNDTAFETGKNYFVKQEGSYRPITEAERAAGMQIKYEITADAVFKAEKTYYVLDTEHPGEYKVLTDEQKAAGKQSNVKYFERSFYYEELSDADFNAQFSSLQYWLSYDIAYKFSKYDFGFIDVYPFYHRSLSKSRDEYNKLRYLCNRLNPVDHIKHKDAPHE